MFFKGKVGDVELVNTFPQFPGSFVGRGSCLTPGGKQYREEHIDFFWGWQETIWATLTGHSSVLHPVEDVRLPLESDCMHSGSVVLKFGVRSISYLKYIDWNNTEMKRLPMTTDWKCRCEPAVGVFLFPFLLSWLCFHLQTRPHVELDELL